MTKIDFKMFPVLWLVPQMEVRSSGGAGTQGKESGVYTLRQHS